MSGKLSVRNRDDRSSPDPNEGSPCSLENPTSPQTAPYRVVWDRDEGANEAGYDRPPLGRVEGRLAPSAARSVASAASRRLAERKEAYHRKGVIG
jgi:hypothetical protein